MPRMGRHGSPTHRGPRYYALLLVLASLLGIGTTIAVAWTIARPIHLNSGARPFGDGHSKEFILRTDAGEFSATLNMRVGGMTCYQVSGQSNAAAWMPGRTAQPDSVSVDELPWWVYVPGPQTPLPPEVPNGLMPTNLLSYAFGWPLPAMRGLVVENIQPSLFLGRDLWKLGSPGGWHRGLPLSPVWPGFAVDSMVFAVPWFVLLRVAGAPSRRAATAVLFRKRMRRRLGLCPVCGYDLRGMIGSGCPECGWGRSV